MDYEIKTKTKATAMETQLQKLSWRQKDFFFVPVQTKIAL